MTDYFVDYANGVAGNAGTSWATAKKKVSDFASGSMSGGDRIKVAKTADAYTIGDGDWTSISDYGEVQAKSVASSTNATPIVVTTNSHGYSTGDLVFIDNHGTNTNARGLWEITVVDENSFSLKNSSGNGVGGATGTCVKCNYVGVKADTPRWKVINDCQTLWTGGTGCTINKSDRSKWGGILGITTSSAVTTARKLAYLTLPQGTTDYSGYEQIGFGFYSTGTITTGTLTINLCSDTSGDTVVDSINIPAYEVANKYVQLVCDKSSALGSSIQSVAIYSTASFASKAIYFWRITAFLDAGNANEITNEFIVGNEGVDEGDWFLANGYTDNYILIGGHESGVFSFERGFYGTTESKAIYVRKPLVVTATDTYPLGYVLSNPAGTPITVSCGWNITTDEVDGETVYDQKYYSQYAYAMYNRNDVYLDNFWGVRFSGLNAGANLSNHKFSKMVSVACSYFHLGFQGFNTIFDDIRIYGCSSGGVLINQAGENSNGLFTTRFIGRNNFVAPYANSQVVANNVFECDCDFQNNDGSGLSLGNAFAFTFNGYVDVSFCGSSNITFTGLDNLYMTKLISSYGGFAGSTNYSRNYLSTASYNYIALCSGIIKEIDIGKERFSIYSYSNEDLFFQGGEMTDALESNIYMRYGGELNFRNTTMSGSATEVNMVVNGTGAKVYSEKHDQTANNHKIFHENGLISADSTTVYSSSPFSWKFSPTSAIYKNENNPLNLKLIKVVCEANVEKTVTVRARRDNTGITVGIRLKAGQLAGLTTEVTDEMTASADTWEQLSISFTPTESGVVCIEAYAYGGSTYNAWFDEPQDDKSGYVFQGIPFHVETESGSAGEDSYVFC